MSETLNPEYEQPVSLDELLHQPPPARTETVQWTGISFEFLAYTALVVLSVLFRLANIDSVPLSDSEASQALSAWHVAHPSATGTVVPASSVVTFWLHYAGFSMLGGSEFSARLPGIIGGLVLILMPLLFRARLGRERAFLLSLILAVSPIGLAASRNADASLWTMIFAVAAFWSFWRYYETRRTQAIALTAGFTGAMLLLAEPGALLLALIIGLSFAAAVWWMAWSAPQDLALEVPGTNILAQAQDTLAGIPWRLCLAAAGIVVLLASTLFMFYPSGLSMVGEVLGGFLRGFWTPAQANAPVGYPVLTLLLFDPLLIIFALAGVTLLVNRERFGLLERFLVAWFVIGIVALTVYRGGTPGNALWLMIPLAVLAVEAVVELFRYRPVMLFLFDDLMPDDEGNLNRRYAWVKYASALVTIALLLMLALHWQEIGRGLLSLPLNLAFNDAFDMLMQQAFAMFRYSFIWFIISLLFLLVGYMMAASIWGNQNTLQGLGIGAFVVMVVSGIGGGWNEAVAHATEPGGIWHTAAVSQDVNLLRTTLFEISLRNTRGFPETMNITVVMDGSKGVQDNGLLAWVLRDYPQARYVNTLEDAQKDEIVLMAARDDVPDLGGTYVGQSFLLRTHWTLNYLVPGDLPAWLAMRRVRDLALTQDKVVLWLRQDVFNATVVTQSSVD